MGDREKEMSLRARVKNVLGDLPLTAEIYWLLRQSKYSSRYSLRNLKKAAPALSAVMQSLPARNPTGKRIFLFGSQYYWNEYNAVLGLALAGLGHEVTLGYLPYTKMLDHNDLFDLRRQDLYTQSVYKPFRPWLKIDSLLPWRAERDLPAELEREIGPVSAFDFQYIEQIEQVDPQSALYRMRQERNEWAVRAAYRWLRTGRPDLLLVPNSSMAEFSMIYRAACCLRIPTVTFEFNENRGEIWLAQDDDIMRQNTDLLWQACGGTPLSEKQRGRIEALEQARMGARTFGDSDRTWQEVPTAGGEQARRALRLDDRPVVLLATNVLGDSLILGRDLFSRSMAEWILRTIQFFAAHPQMQLVVRVHPGEQLMPGPSILEGVKAAFPQLPENVRLVAAADKINTYDLMELTRLGLVYSSTAGLEMTMNGIPVVVCAQTHYRGRGFTYDPDTWPAYFELLEQNLAKPSAFHLTRGQVELAWRYAYLYFFTYPLAFPWGLVSLWKDLEQWPLERVLGPEGQERFSRSFDFLAGAPLDWKAVNDLAR
jgi:hypothetical protein